jgi:hypothetical protein
MVVAMECQSSPIAQRKWLLPPSSPGQGFQSSLGLRFLSTTSGFAITRARCENPRTPNFFLDEPDFHPSAAGRTMFVDAIGRDEVEEVLDRLQSSTAMAPVTQIRVLGGAMARVPYDDTAFAHRRRAIMVNLGALFQDPGQRELHEEWIEEFMATLQADDPAAYVNFLEDEVEERVRQAYPQPTWNRLVEIKGRYDPTSFGVTTTSHRQSAAAANRRRLVDRERESHSPLRTRRER